MTLRERKSCCVGVVSSVTYAMHLLFTWLAVQTMGNCAAAAGGIAATQGLQHGWRVKLMCKTCSLQVGISCVRVCMSAADHCMAALPWGMVIIDESHNLRTTNSRQADAPHTGGTHQHACMCAWRGACCFWAGHGSARNGAVHVSTAVHTTHCACITFPALVLPHPSACSHIFANLCLPASLFLQSHCRLHCRGRCGSRQCCTACTAAERNPQPVPPVRPVPPSGRTAPRRPGAHQGGLCTQVGAVGFCQPPPKAGATGLCGMRRVQFLLLMHADSLLPHGCAWQLLMHLHMSMCPCHRCCGVTLLHPLLAECAACSAVTAPYTHDLSAVCYAAGTVTGAWCL